MKYIFIALFFISSVCNAQMVNGSAILLSATAETGTTINLPSQFNSNYRGTQVVINVSAYTSGNYTPHIQGLDIVSGNWYDILVGQSISSTGETIIKVYPGIGALLNAATPDILPQQWRVQLIGASTPSMTISVSAFLEI